MRRIFEIAAIVLAIALPSHSLAANTWGTDLSDLWWNPDESGWGANVAHQGEIIFMTLFVYGSDSRVRWYVAPALASQGGPNAFAFTGTLYETAGPYLGGGFNPASVGTRQVGPATITFQGVSRASLSYSVDGVGVLKSIQRQTFRNNDLSGSYLGAGMSSIAGCGAGSGNFENYSQFTISQSGSAISIAESSGNGLNCTYSGTYAQSGRMGSIAGAVSCSNGLRGTFQALEVEAGYQGFFARFSADYGGGCTEIGHFGGIKRS